MAWDEVSARRLIKEHLSDAQKSIKLADKNRERGRCDLAIVALTEAWESFGQALGVNQMISRLVVPGISEGHRELQAATDRVLSGCIGEED